MGLIFDLLTLPVLGGPRLVHWLAIKTAEEADRERFDEGRVRAALLELQTRYDAGDIEEEDYDRQEEALLEHLNAIREFKARRSQQG